MSEFLVFHNVSYIYPHQDRYAVQNLHFSVNQGEFLGILGPDNAGKTTIAKLINGILAPSQGYIMIEGTEVQYDDSLYTLRQKIGVVFSDPENQIVGTTVEEDAAFGLGNLCVPSYEIRKRVDTYLNRVGLLKYATLSPYDLSGGEQQKLCLAGVLAMEPACLVLDDPVTFLDTRSQQDILLLVAKLNSSGMTVIYLTSDPEELVHATRVIVLKQGTLLTQCPPSTLWNDLSVLECAGILPSDIMLFRDALKRQGYCLQKNSWRPESIVQDIVSSVK